MIKYTDKYVSELIRAYYSLRLIIDNIERIQDSSMYKRMENEEVKANLTLMSYIRHRLNDIVLLRLKTSPKGLQKLLKLEELERKVNP